MPRRVCGRQSTPGLRRPLMLSVLVLLKTSLMGYRVASAAGKVNRRKGKRANETSAKTIQNQAPSKFFGSKRFNNANAYRFATEGAFGESGQRFFVPQLLSLPASEPRCQSRS